MGRAEPTAVLMVTLFLLALEALYAVFQAWWAVRRETGKARRSLFPPVQAVLWPMLMGVLPRHGIVTGAAARTPLWAGEAIAYCLVLWAILALLHIVGFRWMVERLRRGVRA